MCVYNVKQTVWLFVFPLVFPVAEIWLAIVRAISSHSNYSDLSLFPNQQPLWQKKSNDSWCSMRQEAFRSENIKPFPASNYLIVLCYKSVLVLGVPEQAPSPDTLLSAAGLHTPLYTSTPPAPGIAAHTNITLTQLHAHYPHSKR